MIFVAFPGTKIRNMKTRYIAAITLLLCLLSPFVYGQKDVAFPLGEKIKFKVYYGWFALGEASMELSENLVKENGESYYHCHIEARTIGLFSWLAGIDNIYWGDVNVENYYPVRSETHLDTRKGKWDQWNTYDYNKLKTDVKIMDYSKDVPKREFTTNLTKNAYDVHGTYMYLRSRLSENYDVGDSVMLKAYWVDKLYDFGMEYGGKEKIKFNGEKIMAHKFYGLFPISGTFPKEKAVTVWVIQKDGMSIPLQIEAEMKIGKVRCELKEYTVMGKQLLTSE